MIVCCYYGQRKEILPGIAARNACGKTLECGNKLPLWSDVTRHVEVRRRHRLISVAPSAHSVTAARQHSPTKHETNSRQFVKFASKSFRVFGMVRGLGPHLIRPPATFSSSDAEKEFILSPHPGHLRIWKDKVRMSNEESAISDFAGNNLSHFANRRHL
jgi:hypothetical protein